KLETQKCALILSRQLKMEHLEIIVKDCLNMPELFKPYDDALEILNNEKIESVNKAKELSQQKADTMEKIAWQLLHNSYSSFEEACSDSHSTKKKSEEKKAAEENQPSKITREVDETTIEELRDEYPDIYSEIQKAVYRIDYIPWQELKKKYIFAKLCISSDQNQSDGDEGISILDCLDKNKSEKDESADITYNILRKVNEKAQESSDDMFLKQLLEDNVNDTRVISVFFNEYENWKKFTFSKVAKRISQKVLNSDSANIAFIEKEFRQKVHDIKIANLETIRVEAESKYPE
ncbi:6454_t:CDS:2, partial [Ambispora gerdemannii]